MNERTHKETDLQTSKIPYNTLTNQTTFIQPMQYISKSYKILQNPYNTLTKSREGIDPMHIAAIIDQIAKIPCKNECSIDGGTGAGAGAGAGAGEEF